VKIITEKSYGVASFQKSTSVYALKVRSIALG